MYVEDQDDEVEEEEEFHEVEEEKHKTSQESVGGSCGDKIINSPNRSNKHYQQQEKEQEQPQERQEQNELQQEQKSAPEGSNEVKLDEKVGPTNEENESSDTVAHQKEIADETSLLHEHDQPQAPSELSSQHVILDNIGTEAVDDSSNSETKIPEQVLAEKPNDGGIDWANIMLNSKTTDSSDSVAENLSSDKENSNDVEELQPIANTGSSADDTIDGIIKDTNEKLKIYDGDSSLDQLVQVPGEKSNPAPEGIQADPDTAATITLESHQDTSSHQAQNLGEVPKEEAVDVVKKSDECEPSPSGEDNKIEPTSEVEKKELDLDEDVKNPQYIPKKGVFYEHDDRSHDVEEKKSSPMSNKKEDENAEVKEHSANKKATGVEKQVENRRSNRRQRTDADRWNHDLFKNEKQKPKSKSELINAYGYDIRQERGSRNQADNRAPRANNTDRPQDSQRARQARDVRAPRQNQSTSNRSRERRPRRQNSKGNRGENSQTAVNRREAPINRSSKLDNNKDLRETLNEKHAAQEAAAAAASRRDQEAPNLNRNSRNDSKGRRRTSRDRPSNDEPRLPPANTVMPPITTWSSEDMMKAEAFGKKSPPRVQPQTSAPINSITSTAQRDRSTDFWQQSQPNKNIYPDRSTRNQDEIRHQHHYNSRGRYQERGDENHRSAQFMPRNQFNDRSNQHHEWNRASNFSPYAKSNDYIVKTQTFENSRLSQANVNRANNNRDLREVIDRRVQHNQQNFHNKVQPPGEHHMNQRGPVQGHYHHQYAQSHHYMHQHQQPVIHGQQHLQQSQSPQQPIASNQQHQQSHQQSQRPHQQSPQQPQQASNETQQQQQQSQSQASTQNQQQRQPPTTQAAQSQTHPSPRQNLTMDNVADNGQDSARLAATNNNDLINSRPIIKTDTYNGSGMAPHSQPLPQHSQNHRSMGGPMAHQGTGAANSHLVPTHIGSGVTQAQYYTPSTSSRDPAAAAAALANAYHGYLPGGHSVMDPSRYHIPTQQLSDHGYLSSAGQTNEVATGSVLHQPGLYTDTSAGGTLANSAYLAQSGATLSPTTNIPVTGAGPQSLPPVSYIQHSQYPPPPYSNPYSQPQHSQAPPQSGHPYPPFWTYI